MLLFTRMVCTRIQKVERVLPLPVFPAIAFGRRVHIAVVDLTQLQLRSSLRVAIKNQQGARRLRRGACCRETWKQAERGVFQSGLQDDIHCQFDDVLYKHTININTKYLVKTW